ncbi:hypothetical protein COOONC_23015 [Cooperia oncophora]
MMPHMVPVNMPVPVPMFVPQVVPFYVPSIPTPGVLVDEGATKGSNGKKPVVYYRAFNDKLPGGFGRGNVYEYHAPGHDEIAHSYGTSQSFGSPSSGSFGNSQSSSSGFFKSYSVSPFSSIPGTPHPYLAAPKAHVQ